MYEVKRKIVGAHKVYMLFKDKKSNLLFPLSYLDYGVIKEF